MSKYIYCSKDKKGIIAEVVGNMLKIQKRKNDFNPFVMTLGGKDWDANISCTSCSEVHHIECAGGVLNLTGLIVKDKEATNGEPESK